MARSIRRVRRRAPGRSGDAPRAGPKPRRRDRDLLRTPAERLRDDGSRQRPGKVRPICDLLLAAIRLPRITSERGTWLAVGAIEILWLAILGWQESLAAVLGSGSAIAAALVYSVTYAQRELREGAARASLALANAELLASRELLAENSRAAERLRISRDIHDALGHHLVALSIQLDVASRRPPELAVQDIREAHAMRNDGSHLG